jgi:hypothetical protein
VQRAKSLRPSLEFSHNVFVTLTFNPEAPTFHNWSNVSKLFNRYIQKLRRFHNSDVQYLRVIESHSQGNPHIHCLLRFRDSLTINNGKYFDSRLYAKWKLLWSSGFSDYTPALSNGSPFPLSYLLKYTIKDTQTLKTFWKNYYSCLNTKTSAQSVGLLDQMPNLNTTNPTQPEKSTDSVQDSTPPVPYTPTAKEQLTLLFCKLFHVKQLSWSRHFFNLLSPPQGGTGGNARQLYVLPRSDRLDTTRERYTK